MSDLFYPGEILFINWPGKPSHGWQVTFSMYGPGSRDYDADVFLPDGRRASLPSENLSRENPLTEEVK